MRKTLSLLFCLTLFYSCDGLQEIADKLPRTGGLSETQIANGLRSALDKGIEQKVTQLMAEDGFYRNEAVKILLPQELRKVDKTLRDIGLSSLADEGLKLLNRAAEDAVSEARPIFVSAVKDMTITDARNILLGDNRAATDYLEQNTRNQLYDKFKPVIENSLGKVGADRAWENIINRYNKVPFTDSVNPDLNQYVTNEALEGVFIMIAKEEQEIRTDIGARTTDLLRKVFALQD